MRHADAGYEIAIAVRARARASNLPMLGALMATHHAEPGAADARRSCGASAPAASALAARRRPARAGDRAPAPRWCSAPPQGDAPVYGVNTGFGKLATTRIARRRARDAAAQPDALARVGVGEPLPDAVVRLILAAEGGEPGARLLRRARGRHRHACSRCTTRASCPCMPVPGLGRRLGRPGAAGAPVAGADRRGRVRCRGRAHAGRRTRWSAAGIAPLVLAAKEGLALINGTQVVDRARAARAVRRRAGCSKRRWSSAR